MRRTSTKFAKNNCYRLFANYHIRETIPYDVFIILNLATIETFGNTSGIFNTFSPFDLPIVYSFVSLGSSWIWIENIKLVLHRYFLMLHFLCPLSFSPSLSLLPTLLQTYMWYIFIAAFLQASSIFVFLTKSEMIDINFSFFFRAMKTRSYSSGTYFVRTLAIM